MHFLHWSVLVFHIVGIPTTDRCNMSGFAFLRDFGVFDPK
jgi:hypothetical protein